MIHASYDIILNLRLTIIISYSRVSNALHYDISIFAAPKGNISPSGGDVWVLLISDTKPSDTDLYVCEVNSDPAIKSFHSLKGELNFVICD